MTIRIITFLKKYARDTIYKYQGHTYDGTLFQMAMRQFLGFDETDIFVSPMSGNIFMENLAPLNGSHLKAVDRTRRGALKNNLDLRNSRIA